MRAEGGRISFSAGQNEAASVCGNAPAENTEVSREIYARTRLPSRVFLRFSAFVRRSAAVRDSEEFAERVHSILAWDSLAVPRLLPHPPVIGEPRALSGRSRNSSDRGAIVEIRPEEEVEDVESSPRHGGEAVEGVHEGGSGKA